MHIRYKLIIILRVSQNLKLSLNLLSKWGLANKIDDQRL